MSWWWNVTDTLGCSWGEVWELEAVFLWPSNKILANYWRTEEVLLEEVLSEEEMVLLDCKCSNVKLFFFSEQVYKLPPRYMALNIPFVCLRHYLSYTVVYGVMAYTMPHLTAGLCGACLCRWPFTFRRLVPMSSETLRLGHPTGGADGQQCVRLRAPRRSRGDGRAAGHEAAPGQGPPVAGHRRGRRQLGLLILPVGDPWARWVPSPAAASASCTPAEREPHFISAPKLLLVTLMIHVLRGPVPNLGRTLRKHHRLSCLSSWRSELRCWKTTSRKSDSIQSQRSDVLRYSAINTYIKHCPSKGTGPESFWFVFLGDKLSYDFVFSLQLF